MRRTHTIIAAFVLLVGLTTSLALAGGPATRVENAIWAHDVLYDTVVTQNSFTTPPSHSVDKIYSFGMSGLQGQRSVSEAAPGDTDYNGGRWWVQMVIFTEEGLEVHDPDGDGFVNFELSNAEDVLIHADLGHFEIHETSIYFSCPLNPTR